VTSKAFLRVATLIGVGTLSVLVGIAEVQSSQRPVSDGCDWGPWNPVRVLSPSLRQPSVAISQGGTVAVAGTERPKEERESGPVAGSGPAPSVWVHGRNVGLPEVEGVPMVPRIAFDSNGVLHAAWLTAPETYSVADLEAAVRGRGVPGGLQHAMWQEGEWTEPEEVFAGVLDWGAEGTGTGLYPLSGGSVALVFREPTDRVLNTRLHVARFRAGAWVSYSRDYLGGVGVSVQESTTGELQLLHLYPFELLEYARTGTARATRQVTQDLLHTELDPETGDWTWPEGALVEGDNRYFNQPETMRTSAGARVITLLGRSSPEDLRDTLFAGLGPDLPRAARGLRPVIGFDEAVVVGARVVSRTEEVLDVYASVVETGEDGAAVARVHRVSHREGGWTSAVTEVLGIDPLRSVLAVGVGPGQNVLAVATVEGRADEYLLIRRSLECP